MLHALERRTSSLRVTRTSHQQPQSRDPVCADSAKKKRERMEKRFNARQAAIQSQVQGWFDEFDVDKNNKLDRKELAMLLSHLHPDRPPSEGMLDYLCTKASEIRTHTVTISGHTDASIPWHDVRDTVVRYHDYCKEQAYLDRVFKVFDADASDMLDVTEIPKLLRAAAPSGVIVDAVDVEHVLQRADANSVRSRGCRQTCFRLPSHTGFQHTGRSAVCRFRRASCNVCPL